MTLQELYRQTLHRLREAEIEGAAAEARLLFTHCTGLPFHRLPIEGAQICSAAQATAMEELLARRLAHEPIQYLLGEWEFHGLPLAVGPGVLIPRDDTEVALERALTLLRGISAPVVADLCSGSGALALALWSERPDADVTAVELSSAALEYLRKNVAAICGESARPVRVVEGDVLSPISLPQCDLIVSNPPYITAAEMEKLSPEVQREPAMALFGGADGLRFYRGIAALYRERLKPGGWLVFEIGYDQGETVPAILREAGYTAVEMERDLAGLPRCVWGQRAAE